MRSLILITALVSSNCLAQVYKCTTPDGKTVFQQTACEAKAGQEEVTIKEASGGFDGSQKDLDWMRYNNLGGTGSDLYGEDASAEKRHLCKQANIKINEMQQRAQAEKPQSSDAKSWEAQEEFWKSERTRYCQ